MKNTSIRSGQTCKVHRLQVSQLISVLHDPEKLLGRISSTQSPGFDLCLCLYTYVLLMYYLCTTYVLQSSTIQWFNLEIAQASMARPNSSQVKRLPNFLCSRWRTRLLTSGSECLEQHYVIQCEDCELSFGFHSITIFKSLKQPQTSRYLPSDGTVGRFLAGLRCCAQDFGHSAGGQFWSPAGTRRIKTWKPLKTIENHQSPSNQNHISDGRMSKSHGIFHDFPSSCSQGW